jgi:hypothetical protein
MYSDNTTPSMPTIGGAKKKSGDSDMRYYTATESSIGKPGGRYCSKSGPASAAKKAASKRFANNRGSSGDGKMRLTLRETGTNREFTYTATRTKLAVPIVRKIGGVTVTSEYKVDVKAVK